MHLPEPFKATTFLQPPDAQQGAPAGCTRAPWSVVCLAAMLHRYVMAADHTRSHVAFPYECFVHDCISAALHSLLPMSGKGMRLLLERNVSTG
jgi:hypothetical protein